MDTRNRRTNVLTEQAENYKRCEEKIQAKYGMDYQIILRRTIRLGGFLGFFEKEGVELSFVLTNQQKPQVTAQHLSYNATQKPIDFEEEKKKILNANPPKTLPNPQIQLLLDEVRDLREIITLNHSQQGADDHETITRLEHMLESNEFTPAYIRKIADRVRKDFSLDELHDCEVVYGKVVEWIGETIQIYHQEQPTFPQIIILVGPTGVGKTTTIAKLAANFVLAAPNITKQKPSVRMITIDNYRIAAQQQIEIYGDYMNVPVSRVSTVEDLKKVLAFYGDEVDIILIDTIGYSPKDYVRIADMRKMLDIKGTTPEVYLAMSASTKTSDMREIIQQFEIFGYRSIVLTKFDETTRVGNIISVLAEKNKSVAFITTGQKVPLDIEKASVVRFLIQLADFKINRSRIEQRFPSKAGSN